MNIKILNFLSSLSLLTVSSLNCMETRAKSIQPLTTEQCYLSPNDYQQQLEESFRKKFPEIATSHPKSIQFFTEHILKCNDILKKISMNDCQNIAESNHLNVDLSYLLTQQCLSPEAVAFFESLISTKKRCLNKDDKQNSVNPEPFIQLISQFNLLALNERLLLQEFISIDLAYKKYYKEKIGEMLSRKKVVAALTNARAFLFNFGSGRVPLDQTPPTILTLLEQDVTWLEKTMKDFYQP